MQALAIMADRIASSRAFISAWRGAGAQGAQSSFFKPAVVAISEILRTWLHQHGFPLNDLDATRDNRTTPLMHAARFGRADLISELLQLGANHQARNADGNNALWLACFSGDPASIKTLLDAGIDIDNCNDHGSTCLMYAASSGKPEVVVLLLAAHADAGLENLDGYTALDMAATPECLYLLRKAAHCAEPEPVETLETMDGEL